MNNPPKGYLSVSKVQKLEISGLSGTNVPEHCQISEKSEAFNSHELKNIKNVKQEKRNSRIKFRGSISVDLSLPNLQ